MLLRVGFRVGLGLQVQQVIGGLLGVAGGGKDRLLIVLEHFEPRGDIGGVVVPDFGGQAQFGAQEGATDFRNQFFHRVTRIAPFFAPHVPIQARGVARPVGRFVGQSGVIAFPVAEKLERRHLNKVMGEGIKSLIAAVADIRTRGDKEGVQSGVAFGFREDRRGGLGGVVGRESVNLLHVKHRVALHVGDFDFFVLPGFLVGLGPGEGVGVHDKAAVLAFLDLRAQFLRLLIGHPDGGHVAFFHRRAPQHQGVNAAVGFAVMP